MNAYNSSRPLNGRLKLLLTIPEFLAHFSGKSTSVEQCSSPTQGWYELEIYILRILRQSGGVYEYRDRWGLTCPQILIGDSSTLWIYRLWSLIIYLLVVTAKRIESSYKCRWRHLIRLRLLIFATLALSSTWQVSSIGRSNWQALNATFQKAFQNLKWWNLKVLQYDSKLAF